MPLAIGAFLFFASYYICELLARIVSGPFRVVFSSCWTVRTIQEHIEKLLRLGHRLNPQFLLEHSLAPLILSQRLTTTALGGISLHELPVGFLVTMVHLEDGTSPFCGILVATML